MTAVECTHEQRIFWLASAGGLRVEWCRRCGALRFLGIPGVIGDGVWMLPLGAEAK